MLNRTAPQLTVEERIRMEANWHFEKGDHLFPKSFAAGLACFFAAAKLGHADAFYRIGKCYLYGHGIKRDVNKASRYLLAAVEKGNNRANYFLARIVRKSDPALALTYATRAADGGDSQAQHYLGLVYMHGSGTAKDYDKALYYLEKASHHDSDANALYKRLQAQVEQQANPQPPRKKRAPRKVTPKFSSEMAAIMAAMAE